MGKWGPGDLLQESNHPRLEPFQTALLGPTRSSRNPSTLLHSSQGPPSCSSGMPVLMLPQDLCTCSSPARALLLPLALGSLSCITSLGAEEGLPAPCIQEQCQPHARSPHSSLQLLCTYRSAFVASFLQREGSAQALFPAISRA